MDRLGLSSESWMPGLDQEAKDEVASFLQAMTKIDSEDRSSDTDLLRHPWLGAMK